MLILKLIGLNKSDQREKISPGARQNICFAATGSH